ncbi:MAG TPA: serine protease [Candidatus Eisenbacteria bacterium]|nr:serine protease [Candidatus Eisenbacteria bacterium]
MDKIVISPNEITEIKETPEQLPRVEPKLPTAIPWWARISVGVLVLCLPLLCLITIILRVAFRGQTPRIRYAWTGFLSTLLIISGFLTSAMAVVAFSLGPLPSIAGMATGLAELDERTDFPTLPAAKDLSGADASSDLKPLVAVISPTAQTFFGKREVLSNSFGAGMLLEASDQGYLFATARHVIGIGAWGLKDKHRALVSLRSGIWAGAEVIARHTNLDLVLVWIPRHSGHADFVQPIARPKEGETIFVIGHPEGLKYTLSTGIVSRIENSTLQISAPVSPGNSGGPVYDQQGNLLGVVSSTLDKSYQPNAENLNFAVSAQALLKENDWEFSKNGKEHLVDYLKKLAQQQEKAKKE